MLVRIQGCHGAFIDVYRRDITVAVQLDTAPVCRQGDVVHIVDQEPAVRDRNPAQQIKHFPVFGSQSLRGTETVDQDRCASTALAGAQAMHHKQARYRVTEQFIIVGPYGMCRLRQNPLLWC